MGTVAFIAAAIGFFVVGTTAFAVETRRKSNSSSDEGMNHEPSIASLEFEDPSLKQSQERVEIVFDVL